MSETSGPEVSGNGPIGPLPLLGGEWPLRELFVLNFNANLGFFESAGLAKARARGARVTLVSDADMVHADVLASRFAGRSYLDARAICRGGGSFHPKLVVALGADRAEVLVGSGNTSPGGWISNAELWTKLSAGEEGGPTTLARIADFLDALPPLTRFTFGAHEIMTEVAHALRDFDATEVGPEVVSSAFGPIIEQLPRTEPVDELVVSAPFFDRKATALDALVHHFKPATLDVALHKDANYDGAELAGVIAKRLGAVSRISEDRYHHGKLIEWVSGGTRYALTGSPNISRSALLEAMSTGGNCELGLVSAIGATLRPETGDELVEAEVASHEWKPQVSAATTAPVILLDAILEAKGLRLDLRKPLEAPAQLQHFDDTKWVTFAMVPAGEAAPVIGIPIDGGRRLRLVLADGMPSNVRSVTDLERTNFRHVAQKRSLPARPVEFVFDPRFVTLVEQALAAVRSWSGEAHGPTVRTRAVAFETHVADENWRNYIDGFRAEVGDDFGFFILPFVMGQVGVEAPAPQQGEDEPNDTPGDDPDPEEVDLVAEEITARLIEGQSEKKHLERYRRMAEKLVDDADTRPQPVRVAAAVLTAGGVALGCWRSGADLAELIRRSLRPLHGLGASAEFRRDAASIAAVNLALIKAQSRHLNDGSVASMHFKLAAREVADLLDYAEGADVAFRCAGLVAEGLTQLADPERVMRMVADLRHPDPIAQAAAALIEDGLAAEVDGRVIEIIGTVGHAVTAALRALAAAQDGSPVGVRVRDAKSEVEAVWVAPDLFVSETIGARHVMTRYPLPRLLPSGYLLTRQEEANPARTERWYGPVPPEVTAAFAEAGIVIA